jgi:hypothetical protein
VTSIALETADEEIALTVTFDAIAQMTAAVTWHL